MQFIEYLFDKFDILNSLRLKRIKPRLVRPGSLNARFDSQPVDQADEPKTSTQYPDRSDDTHRARKDLIRRTGQPVPARCAHILDDS